MQDGRTYEHANPQPQIAPGTARRFIYGQEPKIIARVPLKDGGAVEIHGYATHYTQEWVTVAWTDEHFSHLSCWVAAGDVRRPADGEWRGRFVQF